MGEQDNKGAEMEEQYKQEENEKIMRHRGGRERLQRVHRRIQDKGEGRGREGVMIRVGMTQEQQYT